MTAGYREQTNFTNTLTYTTGVRAKATNTGDIPTFGGVYHILADKSLSLYANYSKAFDFQGVNSDGTALPPAIGTQVEGGLKFDLCGGKVSGTADVFSIKRDNVYKTVGTIDPLYIPTDPGRKFPFPAEESKGAEFDLMFQPSKNFQIVASYAYVDAHQQIAPYYPVGSVPKDAASGFARYGFTDGRLKGLDGMFGVIYKGVRPPNSAPANFLLPAEARLDASVGYMFRLSRVTYTARLRVQNLTNNKRLWAETNNSYYSTEAFRNFGVEVSAKF